MEQKTNQTHIVNFHWWFNVNSNKAWLLMTRSVCRLSFVRKQKLLIPLWHTFIYMCLVTDLHVIAYLFDEEALVSSKILRSRYHVWTFLSYDASFLIHGHDQLLTSGIQWHLTHLEGIFVRIDLYASKDFLEKSLFRRKLISLLLKFNLYLYLLSIWRLYISP